MSKKNQVTRAVYSILGTLRSFRSTLQAKGADFDFKKIDPLYLALEAEVSKQGHTLIASSKILAKPRTAKKILADIAESERLTPALLDEIKRSQK